MQFIEKKITIKKTCSVCGQPFDVEVLETYVYDGITNPFVFPHGYLNRKILTDCFYSKFKLGRRFADYKVECKNGECKLVRAVSLWTYIWHKMIELKYQLFKEYEYVEYWECPLCYKSNIH